MVQRIFKVQRSQTSITGWEIEDVSSGKVLDLPDVCMEDLDLGKYIKNSQILVNLILFRFYLRTYSRYFASR